MKVGARAYTAPASARYVPSGVYTGPTHAPMRPGANDAFAVPSLVNGRQMTRQQMREELRAPLPPAPAPAAAETMAAAAPPAPVAAPAPPPTPAAQPVPPPLSPSLRPPRAAPGPRPVRAQAAGRPYAPRIGCAVDKVLHHLHQHGGHVTRAEIAKRHGVAITSMSATFASALKAGALIRVTVYNQQAYALPGYVPPDAPASTPALAMPDASALDGTVTPAAAAEFIQQTAQMLLNIAALLRRAPSLLTTEAL